MTRLCSYIFVACAVVCGPHVRTAWCDEVRDAVEAGNRALIAAFKQGDAQAVAKLYTDDAQVIPPGAPVVRGRAAIVGHWEKSIAAGIKDLALQTSDVESAGDLACETGIARLVDKDGKTSEARYLVVWKRQNGQWKLHRDTWNSADK